MKITGWIGVTTFGYCNAFKAAIKKLNRYSRRFDFADMFLEMAKNCGYSPFSTRCFPQCGCPILSILISCVK